MDAAENRLERFTRIVPIMVWERSVWGRVVSWPQFPAQPGHEKLHFGIIKSYIKLLQQCGGHLDVENRQKSYGFHLRLIRRGKVLEIPPANFAEKYELGIADVVRHTGLFSQSKTQGAVGVGSSAWLGGINKT